MLARDVIHGAFDVAHADRVGKLAQRPDDFVRVLDFEFFERHQKPYLS